MIKHMYKTFLAIALGAFSLQANSLVIDAGSCVDGAGSGIYDEQVYVTGYDCWLNPASGDTGSIVNPKVEDFFTITGSTDILTELYKNDVEPGPGTDPDGDSGAFAGDYVTTYNSDLSGGTIGLETELSSVISCPGCFLLVKDGNHTPSWYLFDISFWDGDTIELSGFWPGGGSVSHVAIWGDGPRNVPEPSVVALLAMGLIGVVVARRRTNV